MNKKLLIISAIWCSSCLVMSKNLRRIEQEYKELKITRLDYDFDEEKVKEYNVGEKLPVLILQNNKNQEINRLIGEKSYKEICKFIESD